MYVRILIFLIAATLILGSNFDSISWAQGTGDVPVPNSNSELTTDSCPMGQTKNAAGECFKSDECLIGQVKKDGDGCVDNLPEATQIFGWLLVVVILMENAFAVIFNSRFFLIFFSRKGLRSLVMIIGASIVVWNFKLDVFTDLFNALVPPNRRVEPGLFSGLLSALTLSGGSVGLHNLMKKLSIRSERKDIDEKPKDNEAWIAVRAVDLKNNHGLLVELKEVGDTDSDKNPTRSVIGMCRSRQPFWAMVEDYFLSRKNRFPSNGGFRVDTNKTYAILVAKFEGDNHKQIGDWQLLGDSYFSFAPKAVIDFDVTEEFFKKEAVPS